MTALVRTELGTSELRAAFALHPSGVVAVCADVQGRPSGLAASTFVPVSLDPPLVSLCVRQESKTWPVLRCAPRLGLSVLGEHHAHVARALAGSEEHRFDDIEITRREHGALLIDDAPLAMTVTVVDDVLAGDHKIVVCRVNEVRTDDGVRPLVFHASAMRGL